MLSSGVWMLCEPPGRDPGRMAWLVAVRLWFGLDVWPAIPDRDDVARVCQNRYVVHEGGRSRPGGLCRSAPPGHGRRAVAEDAKVPTPLDAKGRHALVCKVGGAAMARHDYVRDVLGTALRRLVSGVAWERYVAGIERTDGAEKSRMDLVVKDPAHAALLDLVVFYPLHEGCRGTYAHRTHERAKYQRYRPTEDGRRRHALPLLPVVVSVFGVLNAAAVEWLGLVQATARQRGRPFMPDPGGPRDLQALVAHATILEAAAIVAEAHSQRCGLDVRGAAAGA